jgi:hypothetical protein
MKGKALSREEAKVEARRIVGWLAWADAEAAEKFEDLTCYTRQCDVDIVKEEFYRLLGKLRNF